MNIFTVMDKKIIITGCILGLTAVLLGAFGAHGLKNLVDNTAIESFNTGVRYQMYHSFFLLLVSQFAFLSPTHKRNLWIAVVIGVLLFSGSIYLLVVDTIFGFDARSIAFITPIGGLLLILAWTFVLVYTYKAKF